MKVYAYANCSTCKKALSYLQSTGRTYEILPIREQPPTKAELRTMLKIYEGKVAKLFNTSGQDYRALGLGTKLAKMDDEKAIDLLSKNGNLVKRPFVLAGNTGVVGFKQAEWLDKGLKNGGLGNPNAMTLCTVGADGWPQGRIVLLKGHDAKGFVFYTNSRSEKGQALAAHPRAELVFHWDALGRQVRARGEVQPLSAAETLAYFMTRPRGSNLAAWASQQSQAVESREAMEARLAEHEQRFADKDVEPPPHWWGYRLTPWRVEFWQEGAFRFHDRFVYTQDEGHWAFTRLYP